MKKYIIQIGFFVLLSIICVGAVASASESMEIHAYETALFQRMNDITSEQRVYEILSAHPIEKNINYFAVPWGVFFRRKNLQVKLPAKLNGGFTICQHIRYRDIVPVLRRLGINVLFTPHAPKKQQYKDIKVLPFPLYPVNGIGPAQEKDILYSFIGLESHPVRKRIFSLSRRPDIIIKRRGSWHFYLRFRGKIVPLRWSQRREEEKKEYQEILARSRFSLCPRGTGPSTIRFWESLQAGAIPVLLSDAMALPRVEGINWNDCLIQIPEKKVYSIDSIIRTISPEKEASMREHCLCAYALSCSGENFVRTMRDYFK